MNATETARLLDIISSISPNQKIDPDQGPIWFAILVDTPFTDALEAVKRLARRTPFIGTAEICSEVAVIRRARVQAAKAADELVPNVDPDDPVAFKAERLAIMRAAASGSLDPEAYATSGRTLSGAPPRRAIGAGGSADQVREAIRSTVITRRPPRA